VHFVGSLGQGFMGNSDKGKDTLSDSAPGYTFSQLYAPPPAYACLIQTVTSRQYMILDGETQVRASDPIAMIDAWFYVPGQSRPLFDYQGIAISSPVAAYARSVDLHLYEGQVTGNMCDRGEVGLVSAQVPGGQIVATHAPQPGGARGGAGVAEIELIHIAYTYLYRIVPGGGVQEALWYGADYEKPLTWSSDPNRVKGYGDKTLEMGSIESLVENLD
jgi:hypothetical protein